MNKIFKGLILNAVNKKTILLVEDEAVTSIVSSKTLQKFGYTVIASRTGEEAVEIASNNKNINLILMDIDLGKGIDGTEAAEIILKSCDIPVVFLSSHTEPEIVEKTEKITSYGYVVKNSSNTVLDASIKMAFKLFDAHKKSEIELAERKVIGHALRESEVQYRYIVERVNDTIWLMDMNLKTIWVSPSVVRSRGFTLEELQNMTLDKHMTQESLNKAMILYAQNLTPERLADKNDTINIKSEFEYYRKDGSILLGETEVILQRNEDGAPYGFLCIGTDITDRKQAEEKLHNSEEQFRIILEGSAQGILSVDIETHKVVYCNPAICKMFGYTNEELLQLNLKDLHPEDSLDRAFSDFNKRIISDTHTSSAIPCLRKDGTVFFADLTASKSKINGKDCLVGFFIDITKRIQVEESLRHNEIKYQQLFNYAPTGIYEVDYVSGRFKKVNSVMAGYTDYSEAELLSMNPLDILSDESKKSYLARLDKILAGENVIKNPEYCIKEKSGKLRWVELYTEFLRHEKRIVGAAVVAHDITDRKHAEKILIKFNKTMLSINEFSLNLSYISNNEIYPYIVKKIRTIFNVKESWINLFDEKTSELVFTASTFSDQENLKIVKLFELKLIGYRTFLNKVNYDLIKQEPVGGNSSLYDISFHTIPEIICRGIEKLFGINWFVSVALMNKDKLAGTIVLAGNSHHEIPGREVLLAFANITANALERKQAEMQKEQFLNEIKESEKQLKLITDNIPAFVNYVDARNLRYLFVNLSYADAFGMTPDQIIGKQVKDILSKEAYIRALPYIERAQSGERISYENIVPIQGEPRLFNVNYIPEFDEQGQVRNLFVLAFDITYRKQMESALLESEKKFRSYIENAPEGIFVINRDGYFQDVNDAACILFGYTRDELLRMNFLQVSEIKDLEMFNALIEILKTGATFSKESIIAVKNGLKFYGLLNFAKIDEDKFLVFAADITRRKQEQMLIEAERDLGIELAGTSSITYALKYCMDAAMSVGEMNCGGVYTVDDSGNLTLVVQKGLSDDFMKAVSFYSFDTPNARMAQTGVPVYKDRHDIYNNGRLADNNPVSLAKKEGIKSLAVIPVVMMGKTVACMNISSNIWTSIPEHARTVLERIASRMGLAIYRIKTECRLRDSEEKYRLLHESLMDAFVFVDLNGTIVETNSTFDEMLGYTSDELKLLTYKDLTPEKWHDFESKIVAEQILVNGYSEVYEKEYRRKDGTVFPIDLRTFLLTDSRGKASGMWAIVRDISDRKKTEQDLRESEEKYQVINKNIIYAICMFDAETLKLLDVNERFLQMFGYSSNEISDLTVLDLSAEKEATRMTVSQAKIEGTFYIPLRNHIKKDGTVFPVDIVGGLFTWKGRDVMFGILSDISDRKQMEKDLIKNERMFKYILNTIPQSVFWKDINSIYMGCNHLFAKTVGLKSSEDIIGKTDFDLPWPKEDSEAYRSDDMYVMKNNIPKIHYLEQAQNPDGTRFWVDTSKLPLVNEKGEVYGVLGVYEDITDIKNTEDELKIIQERYKAALENSVDVLYEVDLSGKFTYFDNLSPEHFGYTGSEIINANFRNFMDHENAEMLYGIFHEVFVTGKPVTSVECDWVDVKNNKYTVDVSIDLIKDNNGKYSGFRGVLRDITRRKQAEQRNIMLLEKNVKLLAEKELILREVHHRIKNNMSVIYGLLVLQADTLQDKSAVKALEDAGNRIHSMMVLYDKLYRSSDVQKISVNEYLSSLVDEIISNFPNSKSVIAEKKVDNFILDAKRLQPLGIIINELLSNIMKYAFTGRESGKIIVCAAVEAGLNSAQSVSITIEDNGNGMPESVDFENSTGFGLQLVGILTKELGGNIRIERGNGTKIILKFSI